MLTFRAVFRLSSAFFRRHGTVWVGGRGDCQPNISKSIKCAELIVVSTSFYRMLEWSASHSIEIIRLTFEKNPKIVSSKQEQTENVKEFVHQFPCNWPDFLVVNCTDRIEWVGKRCIEFCCWILWGDSTTEFEWQKWKLNFFCFVLFFLGV